jgi:aryl-alcohol dehydrogenase-like predicted oxidoreductase
VSVVIPGAKSAEQAAMNASAGSEVLGDDLVSKLRALT